MKPPHGLVVSEQPASCARKPQIYYVDGFYTIEVRIVEGAAEKEKVA